MSAYLDFLKRQTAAVQDDLLGKAQADTLRDGTGDFGKFKGTKPLSLEQLAGKAQLISGKPAKQKD